MIPAAQSQPDAGMPCFVFDACIIMNLEDSGLMEHFEQFCKTRHCTVIMAKINYNEVRRKLIERIEKWPYLQVVTPSQTTVDTIYNEHRRNHKPTDGTKFLSKKDINALAAALEYGKNTFAVTNDGALLYGVNFYIERHPEAKGILPLGFAQLLLWMHYIDKVGNDVRWLVNSSCKAIKLIECGRIYRGIHELQWTEKDAYNVIDPYTDNFKKAVSYGE